MPFWTDSNPSKSPRHPERRINFSSSTSSANDTVPCPIQCRFRGIMSVKSFFPASRFSPRASSTKKNSRGINRLDLGNHFLNRPDSILLPRGLGIATEFAIVRTASGGLDTDMDRSRTPMFGSGEEISPWGWQAGEIGLFTGPIESLQSVPRRHQLQPAARHPPLLPLLPRLHVCSASSGNMVGCMPPITTFTPFWR